MGTTSPTNIVEDEERSRRGPGLQYTSSTALTMNPLQWIYIEREDDLSVRLMCVSAASLCTCVLMVGSIARWSCYNSNPPEGLLEIMSICH